MMNWNGFRMKLNRIKMNEQPETLSMESGAALWCSALLADGWRECQIPLRDYARCFYKRFDTPTRFSCNDDKAGAQIQIFVGEFEGIASMELDLRGGLKD